jgi:H+-transporting ATPase
MAPGEDVERGRASSAAERQKSIVSMTEFEGMDEYTALQKYILFYRDPRAAGHHQEEAPKKKRWWQSSSGGAPAADLAAEVPDDCTYSLLCLHLHSNPIRSIGPPPPVRNRLHWHITIAELCWAIIITPTYGGALRG